MTTTKRIMAGAVLTAVALCTCLATASVAAEPYDTFKEIKKRLEDQQKKSQSKAVISGGLTIGAGVELAAKKPPLDVGPGPTWPEPKPQPVDSQQLQNLRDVYYHLKKAGAD